MPVWTVQLPDGEDEQVEAGMLATESGTLVALSDEGSLLSAWAPGQWRTVRCQAAERPRGRVEVLVGVP
jgi:muconolactone delta-isomerase